MYIIKNYNFIVFENNYEFMIGKIYFDGDATIFFLQFGQELFS